MIVVIITWGMQETSRPKGSRTVTKDFAMPLLVRRSILRLDCQSDLRLRVPGGRETMERSSMIHASAITSTRDSLFISPLHTSSSSVNTRHERFVLARLRIDFIPSHERIIRTISDGSVVGQTLASDVSSTGASGPLCSMISCLCFRRFFLSRFSFAGHLFVAEPAGDVSFVVFSLSLRSRRTDPSDILRLGSFFRCHGLRRVDALGGPQHHRKFKIFPSSWAMNERGRENNGSFNVLLEAKRGHCRHRREEYPFLPLDKGARDRDSRGSSTSRRRR